MAKSLTKVALIGCGAIGTVLAEAVDSGRAGETSLVAVFDVVPKSVERLVKHLKHHRPKGYLDFEQFLKESEADIIVEAASQEAVKLYAEQVAKAGKSIMIMSVGALLNEALRSRIEAAAKKAGCRVIVPSGAIGGIDVIKAARLGGLERVTLTTRKNPDSLKYSPYFQKVVKDPSKMKGPVVVFEGAAEEAVKAFPANVNVSAVLSLAGIGGAKTVVRIVADPSATRNIHEIEAEGEFGRLTVRLENIPHPENPRTSYLAVLSAIETLRSITSRDIRIGT
ncbi:MAG: aspartate dehydrogenase [Thaumarchaeota archaeon]|nr:aspartate dehydrogenase [Nitrososphaerota archaeon]